MPSWSAKARRTTSGSSSSGFTTAGSAAPIWSVSTSTSYHPINEAIPRLRQLPDGHLVPLEDLYTAEELHTSRTYNEALLRSQYQQGVNVLLAGPGGSRMTWSLADPVASDGWGSSQIAMVRRLTPHIRQFIHVRQALVRAQAGDTTVTALLENPRIGVLHLDRRGRILAANDQARSLLRQGEELSDEEGVLQARSPDDQGRLARLVAEALPTSGAVPVSGAMQLGRVSGLPPFVVHIKPVGVPQPDYGARPVAALVLIVEPGRHPRLDPALVARTLRLTPAESQVAAWLADGKTVRDIALATGRRESTIRSHVKHMFAKHGLSRQADLVRLVLSLASAPEFRG